MKDYRNLDQKILGLRREYHWGKLEEKSLDPDPFKQFVRWFEDALRAKVKNLNSMTLATSSRKAVPSARTVLLKGFDRNSFVFFSNYESRKGKDLALNPNAVLVFYWPELERQVCVSGRVTKVSRQESLEYFNSRPFEARIAAWGSQQSQPIKSRELLEQKCRTLAHQFNRKSVPMPDNWGGFRLKPRSIEFWQGRKNRLNDRFKYQVTARNRWKITRLQP